MRFLRRLAVVLAGLVALSAQPALAADSNDRAVQCTGDPGETHRLELGPTYGYYAVPRQPQGLVVFAHGYGHNAEDWRAYLVRTAQRDNVIAVAMNSIPSEGRTPGGWWVSEGSAATIAAAQAFDRTCSGLKTIVDYGVSMGGNTSGLAAAAHATRADGRPLFDYWFDIEGATNVIETYNEARALAPANSFAAGAQKDIEAEMGGPIEQKPSVYADHAVVTKAQEIKDSGIKGVVMVHGLGDGLVPYDQSREMQSALRPTGIPVDFFTAVTHGGTSEPGTTLDGSVPFSSTPVPYQSPFAGHGSETSTTQLVIITGFDRLHALFADGEAPQVPGREQVVDGTTGLAVGN